MFIPVKFRINPDTQILELIHGFKCKTLGGTRKLVMESFFVAKQFKLGATGIVKNNLNIWRSIEIHYFTLVTDKKFMLVEPVP